MRPTSYIGLSVKDQVSILQLQKKYDVIFPRLCRMMNIDQSSVSVSVSWTIPHAEKAIAAYFPTYRKVFISSSLIFLAYRLPLTIVGDPDVFVLAHELIHHQQYRSGKIRDIVRKGGIEIVSFAGQEYELPKKLDFDYIKRYMNLPWEMEANSIGVRITKKYAEKYGVTL